MHVAFPKIFAGALWVLLGFVFTEGLLATDRVALVVGCANYVIKDASLSTPLNDADDMAKTLREALGFTVIEKRDAKLEDFIDGLAELKQEAEDARIALVYFSGHGIERDGANYCIPVDAKLEQPRQLDSQTVPLERILREYLEKTPASARVVILDACRDNPFARTKAWRSSKRVVSPGVLAELGPAEMPQGLLISYAAAPGKLAAAGRDEDARNSLYTELLLKHLADQGKNLRDIFETVSDEVSDITEKKQIPWVNSEGGSSIVRKLILVPAGGGEHQNEANKLMPSTSAPPISRSIVTPKNCSKTSPFVNSLGMKFVPVPITGGPTSGRRVLFSIWETRVADFRRFVDDSGYDAQKDKGCLALEPAAGGTWEWKRSGADWQNPHFPASLPGKDNLPVVCLTWNDAEAFCNWLTNLERGLGIIGSAWTYRLPTDHEWSCAVGIGAEENAEDPPRSKRPIEQWSKTKNITQQEVYNLLDSESPPPQSQFPWGTDWPPPKSALNYDDGSKSPAAVGKFQPNTYGIYDLGGNVSEWCKEYFFQQHHQDRVIRGGAWVNEKWDSFLSSNRSPRNGGYRKTDVGFRIVLDGADNH